MSVHIHGSLRFLCLAVVTALSVAAVGAAQAQQKTDVIFSAGPTGGSWTPMGAAAAQIINKRFPELNVQVEPGAALVNMEKIRSDKADLGWSMTTVMADAQKGEGQFEGKKTDKALYVANFYPNVWQLVVPASSNIKSVNGRPTQLTSSDDDYIDYYGRPWSQNWDKLEADWEKPAPKLPGILGRE